MMNPAAPSGAAAPLFDAVLMPHRSLSRPGFLMLMAALCTASLILGTALFLAGAWPAVGFLGLDVALVYLAFRASYRSARLYETVRLTRDDLVVNRVRPSGARREWRFPPMWLRVEIDEPAEPDSRLMLSTHGRHLAIGSFLPPQERVEFAHALRAALRRWRETC